MSPVLRWCSRTYFPGPQLDTWRFIAVLAAAESERGLVARLFSTGIHHVSEWESHGEEAHTCVLVWAPDFSVLLTTADPKE